LRGKAAGPSHQPVADLDECDVLEIDCEGPEDEILSALEIRPETIIVEGHAHYGTAIGDLISILSANGYVIDNIGGDREKVYNILASHKK
jgi:hypothetical protein